MSEGINYEGIWTALVTPFLDDQTVDWKSYEALLDRQLEAGVSGVVICGTTGEANSLLVQEKLSLIKKAKAVVGHKLKIMAGTGGPNTEQTLELSKISVESGADALLIVAPPYSKPNSQGLLRHFEYLASHLRSHAPICLYHVPSRTGQYISEKTLLEILSIDGIDSIKESSADLTLLSTLTANQNISVLSGEDPLYLPSLAIGAKGLISVTANVFPKELVELHSAFMNRDLDKANRIHQVLLDFTKNLFIESNPCPCKEALSLLGLCKNQMRLPLAPISTTNKNILQRSLDLTQNRLKTLL